MKIFADLADADLAAIGEKMTWLRVMGDQTVIDHLDRSSSFFVVLDGQVRARIIASTGREVAFRIIAAGGHFGEIAILADTPRTATVKADMPSLLAEAPRPLFGELLARHPSIGARLLEALARNVVMLTDRVFELSAFDVRARVCSMLLRLSRRGETDANGRITIVQAPTQVEFAGMIGAQREAVARELSALTKGGLITHKRREIVILDPPRLRKLVEASGGVSATHLVDWSL